MIAAAQITIRDENDMQIASAAPVNPVVNTLWLDTSDEPARLKRFDGEAWRTVNDAQEMTDALESLLTRVTAAEMTLSNESVITSVRETLARQATTVNALRETVDGQAAAMGSFAGKDGLEALEAEAAALRGTVTTLESRITQLSSGLTVEVTARTAAQSALETAQNALRAVQDALSLYVRITTGGVEIGRPGDPVRLTADNAQLDAANVTVRERLSIGNFTWRETSSGLGLQWEGA